MALKRLRRSWILELITKSKVLRNIGEITVRSSLMIILLLFRILF